jgi:octaprenyl-diphosphate synthase
LPEAVNSQEIPPSLDIQAIRALVAEDMRAVDNLIQDCLHSDIPLINQLGHYIVNSGGKRLRPILILLIAEHFNYRGDQHINVAAIIELVHTATLLHDDVVDASALRRGQVTANHRWGNEASVLVGDFLYSRAFEMMVDTDSIRVMEILSKATNTIAEGEVQQLLNRNDPKITEARYLEVIRSKTAKLFEASGQLAAVVCRRPKKEELALANYGAYLGTAFQLIDDVLDYSATSSELGKNIGDDLAEGKPTLPLLYAMWHGTPAESKLIRQAIINGGLDDIGKIKQAIASTGAIAYTARLAEKAAGKAIKSLNIFKRPSVYLDALQGLARFAVERSN